ncbi:MAG: glycosyltransferase family 4 protein, partial [Nitrososphaerota archaeon]|nr:glycosyltransferase family 4 protein [Nitrososphaerota archaeon]
MNTAPFVPLLGYNTVFGMHVVQVGGLIYAPALAKFEFRLKQVIMRLIARIMWDTRNVRFHALTIQQANWLAQNIGGDYTILIAGNPINCKSIQAFLKGQVPDSTNSTKFRMLYFGSLSNQKGFDNFLEICERISSLHLAPGIEFVVAGDGPLLSSLRSFMTKHSNVTYYGTVSDEEKISIMANADIFVYPTISDIFPYVVAEAQLCGLPTITSDVIGSAGIVVEGETGSLISPRSTSIYVRKVVEYYTLWLEGPENYSRIRANIREVSQRLCMENVLPKLLSIFEDFILIKDNISSR